MLSAWSSKRMLEVVCGSEHLKLSFALHSENIWAVVGRNLIVHSRLLLEEVHWTSRVNFVFNLEPPK